MSEWIQIMLSVAGMVVGILVVYLQVLKQHKANLQLQAAGLKNQIKVDLYREVAGKIDHAIEAIIETEARTRSAVWSLESSIAHEQRLSGLSSGDLADAHYDAERAINGLLAVMERYEIVAPELRQMREEASEELQRFGRAHQDFHMACVKHLPLADKYQRHIPPHIFPLPIRTEELDAVKAARDAYFEVCHDFLGYIMDFNVECQNVLLGPLFDKPLRQRLPLDPSVKVLTPGQVGDTRS